MAKFQIPKSLKHRETVNLMRGIAKKLEEEGRLDIADLPQLHRMATAYDTYLTCFEFVSENGLTMKNNKGETVKRPEANLMRENWTQYLELAKEYGLTTKSRGQIRSLSAGEKDDDSPLDQYIKTKMECRDG